MLAEWHTLLGQLRTALSAMGVLLHELDESSASTSSEATPGPFAEAVYWHERAASAVIARQEELDRLAGWTGLIGNASIPAAPNALTLAGLAQWGAEALRILGDHRDHLELRDAIERACDVADDLTERAERLAALADDLVEETEFEFLFNRERQLFSIGFNVAEGRLDPSHYDTLASEARLASFVGIATGRIPHEHWFKLGRSLTPTGTSRALLSWSASMFEYLMPLLIMRAYPNTLLDETYEAVVSRQMQYGAQRGVPWGISESAYNAAGPRRQLSVPRIRRTRTRTQTRPRRRSRDRTLCQPCSRRWSRQAAPSPTSKALRRGRPGRTLGYYEAIDYTEERLPKDHRGGVVLPTYMAHHQGMSLVALDKVLNDRRCSGGFTPTRGFRRPNCFSRNASRTSCR